MVIFMVMVMGIFLFSNVRKAVCCVIYFFCWFYYQKVEWISVCGIFTPLLVSTSDALDYQTILVSTKHSIHGKPCYSQPNRDLHDKVEKQAQNAIIFYTCICQCEVS